MKTLTALLALLLLGLTACSSPDGSDAVATDPAPSAAAGSTAPPQPAPPSAAPAAPARVSTRGLVTVIDTGAGPVACLGPVAVSYPPQCTGPAVTGWDWATLGQGMHEQQAGTRWGSYALTGTWDGATLGVDGAVPAALFDTVPQRPTLTPGPATSYPPAELEEIAATVREVPGIEAASVVGPQVLADAAYDDGSLQAWADAAYGAGVVLVATALVDLA